MVDSVRDVTQHARAQGIVLAVENHNHDGFIRAADDVLRLLDDVSSPWLRLLLDTGNFTDLYDSMERTADRAVFVHAKLYDVDPEQGEQRLDYGRIMAILHQVDYNGYLSIEYEGEAAEEPAVAAGVRYLRTLID